MSCHLSYRLTTVHRAISMALLYSVGYVALTSSAQAATIGKTVVTSAQHEPLAASIVVTDIRAADFSASLANPAIYQQMGLTKTDSMMVRFTPTSATSGRVIITTSQPVSKPFADVVLTINDKGQSNVIPKTLLMPLDDGLPINTSTNINTGAKKPNLPSVSASTAKPLTLRRGAPPPLVPTSSLPAVHSSTSELIAAKSPVPSMQATRIQAPTVTASAGNSLSYAPSRLDNGRLTDKANSATQQSSVGVNSIESIANDRLNNNSTTANDANNSKAVIAVDKAPTQAITDKQLDILNIQVTRQIQPRSEKEVSTVAASTLNTNMAKDLAVKNSETNLGTSDATSAIASTGNIPANIANSEAKVNNNPEIVASANSSNMTNSVTAQYQVQRNDSLWMIAQQIAQENNLNVQTVMKQIQSQNPDAFINRDAGQLKADAKLSLPSYDVIPSQKKLEAAISAQRQYSRRSNASVIPETTEKRSPSSSERAQTTKPRVELATTKTQTLPKAQFSVLAPDYNGSADGTQAKSAATKGNGLSTDILATLKSSRQSTATQAQRLSKTSSTLDNYAKKIQLQNQKLAELQARLKKLRNQ
ncbi:type IV pilus assembly protein FimV [Psychrobacter alimentarius]|uniref:type IV pilus assembly protein FimV n=1 Tax=Psychrobacter alimentarius TaxID=261164 RepID=UPI003FD0D943